MDHTKYKYIIIGAGLSGLITAHKLIQEGADNFIILEGRNRIGGRIHTVNQVDLGATWFQDHHIHLSRLIFDLGLTKFRQYTRGKSAFVYSSMAPPNYFEQNSETAAYRIAGGSIALTNRLSQEFNNKILLQSKVDRIQKKGEQLIVLVKDQHFIADQVIIAIPPKIALDIEYDPPLPGNLKKVMSETHTWMSNAIKAGLSFRAPFWKSKNLSGTMIGHIAPFVELYDHSNYNDDFFSLMGFVNEGLRADSKENRKERILNYLESHFGGEIRNFIEYIEKDWSADRFTCNEPLNSVYISPKYGNEIFKEYLMGGKLIFSGAETSSIHGGYMDGAVFSGLETAKRLLSNN